METTLHMTGGGTLRITEDGPRLCLYARRPGDGRGLYKVWLTGQGGGRLLLGTLVPEGGELRLSRTLSRGELEGAGCWPVGGAEAVLAFAFGGGEDWRREDRPGTLVADPLLKRLLNSPMCFRRKGEGFQLAAPFRPECPVPAPIICLARLESLGSQLHLVWTFDGRGGLVLPAG